MECPEPGWSSMSATSRTCIRGVSVSKHRQSGRWRAPRQLNINAGLRRYKSLHEAEQCQSGHLKAIVPPLICFLLFSKHLLEFLSQYRGFANLCPSILSSRAIQHAFLQTCHHRHHSSHRVSWHHLQPIQPDPRLPSRERILPYRPAIAVSSQHLRQCPRKHEPRCHKHDHASSPRQ